MAELILRPNEVESLGQWSEDSTTIVEYLSDNSNLSTDNTIHNTSGNQSLVLALTDIPSAQSNVEFISAKVTIHAHKSNKSLTSSTRINLMIEDDAIVSNDHIISEDELAAYEGSSVSISDYSQDQLNSFTVQITGLLNTQTFYSEVFVTLVYTDPPVTGGAIRLENGSIQLTSGKITL